MSILSYAGLCRPAHRRAPRDLRDDPHPDTVPVTPTQPVPTNLRFFVFTCRNPDSDFRRPLVDALRKYHEVYYIWMRRRPIVSGPDHASPASDMSLAGLAGFLARDRDSEKINIYFNSTDTCFPGLMLFIQSVARRGVWCLDMHDDLRYYHQGLARIRQSIAISLLDMSSHVVVRAAPTLSEIFPKSYLLGNASHILPLSHEGVDPREVLILTSFDARFDFDFVARLATASMQTRFHIHGWTRHSDPETLQRMSKLVNEHANILYHGPYTTDDLSMILSAYRVTVAPYRVNSSLTRHIDPLRFYHCLNAGLEVISTDIPPAKSMGPSIHVVRDAEHCAETLKRIQAGDVLKAHSFVPITWDQRASRLIDIINGLERTKKLCAGKIHIRAKVERHQRVS
jgi:hypothetical protein